MNIKTAKRFDDILQKFHGNISVTRENLEKSGISENDLCALKTDGVLHDVKHEGKDALHLTDKGIKVKSNTDDSSYISKTKKDKNKILFKNTAIILGIIASLRTEELLFR